MLKKYIFQNIKLDEIRNDDKGWKFIDNHERGRVVSLQSFEHFEVISMVNNKRDHKNM